MLDILFENEDFVVINKPSGISVHGDGRNTEKTISDFFVEQYKEAKDVGESIFSNDVEIKKGGIVHRLDKDTSGALVLVKNQDAYEFLKKQFQDRKVKKIYLAIVNGFFKNETGTVKESIGRSPNDFRKRLAGRGARGELREAVTEYKVLKSFTDEKGEKYSIVEVNPKTGRMHQIRVHMKYISHPIVCDPLYNPNSPHPLNIQRLALHALSVSFLGRDGKEIKVEAPMPSEFKELLA